MSKRENERFTFYIEFYDGLVEHPNLRHREAENMYKEYSKHPHPEAKGWGYDAQDQPTKEKQDD